MYAISRTETFLKYIKKHKNNHELFRELDNKIQRLKENPISVGGELAGRLHGKRSTRLGAKFRLIFEIDENNKLVYLIALDHRGEVYK